jgi:hypothetical protein
LDVNYLFLLAEPAGFAAAALLLHFRAAVLDDRRGAVIAVLMAASAVGAALSGASPTGWAPLDVLLLAGMGSLAVAVGLASATRLALFAAIVGAIAGLESVALPLALAASGILVASLLVDSDSLLDGAATALVTQAALRLTSPGGRGATALVAVFMLVPLVVDALLNAPPEVRRTVRRAALAALGLAVLGAGVGALAAFTALDPLRRGVAAVGNLAGPGVGTEVDGTNTRLAEAGKDFADARRTLDAWWARPAAVVPIVSQHWRVLRDAAVAGDDLAAAGRQALDAPALADIRVVNGQVPLDQLAAVAGPVEKLADHVTSARRRLAVDRSPWLVPPLADKLDTQLVRVTGIERTTRSVSRTMPLLPGLLGGDGPRRYFLAVLSPVELRAGGGFLGNFGEIVADNGRLTLTRFGRPQELDDAGGTQRRLLASEEFITRYSRFSPELEWANVNPSPDFPSDAVAIEGLYPQSGGEPIDGVISVDPTALAALLRVVGAVTVPSWPSPITADNALQILLFDQYREYENRARIDFLGEVAQESWRRLTTGELPAAPQVLAALGPSVRTKHMLFWSNHPEEQRLFEELGAAGNMPAVNGDFAGLVTQNASGNKIDYFLRRALDYKVRVDTESGRLDATATITLRNEAPASGLPPTIIGNEVIPPLPDGSSLLYVSFYTPWQLVGARLDGAPVIFEDQTELGRKVYSAGVLVPPKGQVVVELRLTGRLPDAGGYRLDVFRQPTVVPDELTTTLAVDGRRPVTADRQLDADVTIEVP